MTKTRCILIIDDDNELVEGLKQFLNHNGFQTISASTGSEGLKIAIEEKPDVIVLDILMPGVTGWEVCDQLQANAATRHIPVIVMSSTEPLSLKPTLRQYKAKMHLRKPFPANDLVKKIRHLLA